MKNLYAQVEYHSSQMRANRSVPDFGVFWDVGIFASNLPVEHPNPKVHIMYYILYYFYILYLTYNMPMMFDMLYA
jgi:hypothetical protein